MRAYLCLVFLLFFAVFTSGHVNIVEVPHEYFLNSTKEVVTNYKTRKCVSCNNPLGISKDTVIVIHHETYTFTIANTSTAKQTSGLRGIHARHPCMFSRYPYITEACFYSKLNQDLDEIFNH